MYYHNKAQQSKNRVHISWDILYMLFYALAHGANFIVSDKKLPASHHYPVIKGGNAFYLEYGGDTVCPQKY